MSTTPADKSVRGLQINVQLLGGFAVSFVSILVGAVGFQHWVDSRVSDGVRNYANELIYPRIDSLEASAKVMQRDQRKILEMIESQENSRNRQYGELKRILENM